MNCVNKITIPQFGGTCWLNSLLTVLFFSDGMSDYLKPIIKERLKRNIGKNTKEILTLFLTLVHTKESNKKETLKFLYDKLTPENIIQYLYERNKKRFFFNIRKPKIGYNAEWYLISVLDFLKIRDKFLFVSLSKNTGLYYFNRVNTRKYSPVWDPKSGEYSYIIDKPKLTYKEAFKKFKFNKVEVVVVSGEYDFRIEEQEIVPNLHSLFNKETLKLKKKEFNVDSMLFRNINVDDCHKSHQIAGISCNNERYIYNGHRFRLLQGKMVPCKIMKYDWVQEKRNFCLDRKCVITTQGNAPTTELCYRVGTNTTQFFVLSKKIVKTNIIDKLKQNKIKRCPFGKQLNPETGKCINIKKPVQKKGCPIGKVLNPKTGRCKNIKKPVVKKGCPIRKVLNPTTGRCINKKKGCPIGKVLNPKTGRCINMKKPDVKVEKRCPVGKVLNLKTGRCINMKKPVVNVEKQCPVGKVLNPKTGRCINKIYVG